MDMDKRPVFNLSMASGNTVSRSRKGCQRARRTSETAAMLVRRSGSSRPQKRRRMMQRQVPRPLTRGRKARAHFQKRCVLFRRPLAAAVVLGSSLISLTISSFSMGVDGKRCQSWREPPCTRATSSADGATVLNGYHFHNLEESFHVTSGTLHSPLKYLFKG